MITFLSGDYYGLPTRILQNDYLRVECLAEAGPRIVRLQPTGGSNLLAEVPDIHWSTPYGEYYVRGGHRLWRAPEGPLRTYVPDNEGLTVDKLTDGLLLRGPSDPATGICKNLEVHLDPARPQVRLVHSLENTGAWSADLAPWAITQLRLGGWVVLPLRAPGAGEGLLPDRNLVLWPYTRWSDSRLMMGDDTIRVNGLPGDPPCKIGYLNDVGWLAYALEGWLLLKRFDPQPGLPHADRGCNTEVYCNHRFIELETLGPLAHLEPGGRTEHVEIWQVCAANDPKSAVASMRQMVESPVSFQ